MKPLKMKQLLELCFMPEKRIAFTLFFCCPFDCQCCRGASEEFDPSSSSRWLVCLELVLGITPQTPSKAFEGLNPLLPLLRKP
ncbi:uncharacterized [Tachysurus ichikawai]